MYETVELSIEIELISKMLCGGSLQVERSIQQKHMVNWIIDNVKKAVAAESDAENLKKCIADLKGLAARQ